MDAWASDQGIANDSIIKLMGDPYGDLTEKLDMELIHAGPKSVGLINRCKRFALYMENGAVKIVRVAEAEDVSSSCWSIIMTWNDQFYSLDHSDTGLQRNIFGYTIRIQRVMLVQMLHLQKA